MRFSANGKRLFVTSHAHFGTMRVTQISLSKAFDTSSFTIDGSLQIGGAGHGMADSNSQPRGIAFSKNGLQMYVTSDRDNGQDEIFHYDLTCPFNIIEGKCPEITAGDRLSLIHI